MERGTRVEKCKQIGKFYGKKGKKGKKDGKNAKI